MQIREAFAALPFAKPSVRVFPVGGRTLVNLPTYYQILWDTPGLQPGQVSAPVQLSWSVEFEVSALDYDVAFGDGTTSGATVSVSAPYPNSTISHAYTAPAPAAAVTAQTRLIGRYRVNGGAWVALDTVADLADEPVTTLEVLQARAELVTR